MARRGNFMAKAPTRQKMKPAAKFLMTIIVLVGFFIISAIALGLWMNSDPTRMLRIAFTPSHSFADDTLEPQRDYKKDVNWAALPTKASHATDKPQGIFDIAVVPETDVFFVHPTTFLGTGHWNAPSEDIDANDRIDNRVMKMQASVFNSAGRIFAPRYRQATFGAFFDQTGDGLKSIAVAFQDVLAAFDNFIETRSKGRPFILAGHSQGSLHLLHLLHQRITGTPLQRRMVAAYLIGWPVSIEADLGAMADIKACKHFNETGCVISYQTFGLGGDPSGIVAYMDATTGLGDAPRKDTHILCTNPQDWIIGGEGARLAHLGALIRPQDDNEALGTPIEGFSGSQCGDDGLLYLTDLPGKDWQELKMYGENYHVYDYHMFYMNIRKNATERAQNWHRKTNSANAIHATNNETLAAQAARKENR